MRHLVLLLLLLVTLGFARPAAAVSVTVCVNYTLEYNDDDGTLDDAFNNKTGTWTREAEGAQVRITRNSDSAIVFDDNLATAGSNKGCTTNPLSLDAVPHTVVMYAEANSNGNTVVVKNSSFVLHLETLDSAWTPSGSTETFTAPERSYFNIVAVAAFAFQRLEGYTGTMAFITQSCPGPWGGSTSCADVGYKVYISAQGSNFKSTIAHEMGHEFTIAADTPTASELPDGDYTQDFDSTAGAFAGCAASPGGTEVKNNHEGWRPISREWQSAAATEGFAEFFAFLVFNEFGQDEDGWTKAPSMDFDLDGAFENPNGMWYSTDATAPEPGVDAFDYLGDYCGSGSNNHQATVFDWHRFLWDLKTDGSGSRPTFVQILNIWAAADPHTWNTAGTGPANDFPPRRLEDQASNAGWGTRWNNYDNQNGVHR